MTKIFQTKDVDKGFIKKNKIAVLGFGSQGHAHALNLKDSGYDVIVGLKKDSISKELAEKNGLKVLSIANAVKESEIIMVLIPDENHQQVFNNDIKQNISEGNTLMFAHGFSIVYSQVQVPSYVDVIMVAPKGPGHLVRREYLEKRGVPALLAIYQDFSGNAKKKGLDYAYGIGSTRAGVLKTTFEEETETDLFGEQAVLCGGITSLMKAGYETLVEAGYQPQMAYFECINEMKLIVDLIYEGGFSNMRNSISNTAEYGDYITQDKLITKKTKEQMRIILDDIRSGRFAKDWILENKAGLPSFKALRKKMNKLELERVGEGLRGMMPWLSDRDNHGGSK